MARAITREATTHRYHRLWTMWAGRMTRRFLPLNRSFVVKARVAYTRESMQRPSAARMGGLMGSAKMGDVGLNASRRAYS